MTNKNRRESFEFRTDSGRWCGVKEALVIKKQTFDGVPGDNEEESLETEHFLDGGSSESGLWSGTSEQVERAN